MFEQWGGYLAEVAAERLAIELTAEQVEKFCRYGDLLLMWNERMNLTAITEPKEVVIKHFVDSLTFVKLLPGNIGSGRMIDIGTGAGFPGIPIKIFRSELEVTLADSLGKRLRFLDEVIGDLNLKGIVTMHARAEEIGRNPVYREKCDVATARAVARLPVLLEYALPMLKVGGLFLAGKGGLVDEEIGEAGKALDLLGGKVGQIAGFHLGKEAEHRAIVVVEKITVSSKEYPRRPGVPEKKPL